MVAVFRFADSGPAGHLSPTEKGPALPPSLLAPMLDAGRPGDRAGSRAPPKLVNRLKQNVHGALVAAVDHVGLHVVAVLVFVFLPSDDQPVDADLIAYFTIVLNGYAD